LPHGPSLRYPQDMTARAVTACVIIAAIVLLIGYDLAALLLAGDEGTISRVLRYAADRWGMLPGIVAFAMGCLFGHWFF